MASVVLSWLRRATIFAALLCVGSAASAATAPLAFQDALSRGIVDFMFNPWSKRNDDKLIAATIALKPGIVNRLGFAYGGPSQDFLDKLDHVAKALRAGLPDVRLGGGFPEVVSATYSEALRCDADGPPHLFVARSMARIPTEDGTALWMDLSRQEAIGFYACIGKILIRQGFSHFHFEQASTTVGKSTSASTALEGLDRLRTELTAYAARYDIVPSFSGDAELAARLSLDAIYMPSRFYIDSFARQYRNRIDLPASEGGYTYALSPRIVSDTLASLPKTTIALFYIDNFDASQDDLRRFMELGALARRSLVLRSARTAAAMGAVFIPSLNHCEGCVPKVVVVDACEIVEQTPLTEYDAEACGDMATIGEALEIQRRQFRPHR